MRPRRIWAWLTEPPASIREAPLRRRARLLLGILLCLFLLTAAVLVSVPFQKTEAPGPAAQAAQRVIIFLDVAFLVFLASLFFVVRAGRSTMASLLLVGTVGVLCFAAILLTKDRNQIPILIIPMLLCGILLPLRFNLSFVPVMVVGVVLIPLVLPELSYSSLTITLIVMIVVALLGIAFSSVRDRDLAELEAANTSLREMAVIVEASQDAIAAVDLAGVVTSWNKGAERIYGYTAEEMIGKSIRIIIPPESREDSALMRERVGAGEHVVLESVRRRKDGVVIQVSLSLSPIMDTGGKFKGLAIIGRDITAQKAVEAQLIRAQRLESLATLAGGVAHRFNNVNAGIQGYLEIALMDRGIPPRVRESLQAAMESVGQSAEITTRLLGLTASATPPHKPLCLETVIRPMLPIVEEEARPARVSVQADLEDTTPVWADRAHIGFIFTSLFSNALHALLDRPERRICVRTGTQSGFSLLEVSDTGCGIPPENLSRIFSPFFTTKGEFASPGSPQANVRGAGLSLAVCHVTVSEYGGRIDVESEPGRGSIFRILLPKA